jgi:periplasmic divalent cation tolerance protein
MAVIVSAGRKGKERGMTEYLQIFSTVDSDETARRLATELVERRLAACVQIVPNLRSVYWWQGKVEEAAEYLLLIKSTEKQFPALEAAVRELHPYACPELVGLKIAAGLPAYLDWLQHELQG